MNTIVAALALLLSQPAETCEDKASAAWTLASEYGSADYADGLYTEVLDACVEAGGCHDGMY